MNAALTGNRDTSALENDIADAIFFTGLFIFISTIVSVLKYAYRSDPYPAPEGYKMVNKGHSRGAIEPKTLKHQLALEQAASNPTAGTQVSIPLGDSRWQMTQGWVKMQQEFYLFKGEKVTIHYVMNKRLMLIDDFKIVHIK